MKEIITKRLTLRSFIMNDLDDTHVYASDPEVTKYTLFGPNTIDETKTFIEDVMLYEKEVPQKHFEYAIVYNHHVIGAVSIHFQDDFQVAEMGWILNRNYQGQGFAYEAACALKETMIERYHPKRLIAHCDSRNTPSYRLMEKLGFQEESLTQGVEIHKKEGIVLRDELLYALNVSQ